MPIPRITKEALKERLESGGDARPILLDVRLKYPYEHSTVKLPESLRALPHQVDASVLPPGRDVVAYDSDPDEIVSAMVVANLLDRGVAAMALKGGIAEWMAAGYPTESKDAPKLAAAAAAPKG
jgi:rhodanese-related sulfurtransferase